MAILRYKDPKTGEYKSDIYVEGAVSSVNNMTGPVNLDAEKIPYSSEAAHTPGSVGAKLSSIGNKMTEPSGGLAVGKYFRIASIDDAGHPVLEAVDLPIASFSAEGVVRTWNDKLGTGVYNNLYISTTSKTIAQYLSMYDAGFVGKGTLENLLNGGYIQRGYISQTITISAASWSNNTVTVSVEGVTADNLVQLTCPTKVYMDRYGQSGVFCSAQGAGTLTFTCEYTPSEEIKIDAVIWR